jgi:hypothetical protein
LCALCCPLFGIVVSNTYYVVFLFDLCALCCPLFGIVVSSTYYVVFLFDLCALYCPLFGIVVSNTYYVVFLFDLCALCCPLFLDCTLLIYLRYSLTFIYIIWLSNLLTVTVLKRLFQKSVIQH